VDYFSYFSSQVLWIVFLYFLAVKSLKNTFLHHPLRVFWQFVPAASYSEMNDVSESNDKQAH
jgi:hypothetical protein